MSRITLLGVECDIDFDDRVLLRDILETWKAVEALDVEGRGVDVALVSLDLIDTIDDIILRAVGQEKRDELLGAGKAPIQKPVIALRALIAPAGKAYDEMFRDFTTEAVE